MGLTNGLSRVMSSGLHASVASGDCQCVDSGEFSELSGILQVAKRQVLDDASVQVPSQAPGYAGGNIPSSSNQGHAAHSSGPNSVTFSTGETKLKWETDEEEKPSLEELRSQIFELLTVVETLKKDHGKELEKLKKDLAEEKQMRTNLEVEIEKLKKAVMTT
ncbi:hypothetical protein lerEdw1_018610 [Lerista edwardsae]|nr:hypothetical protein lerEdw1_018610 [Lerista edwardsae]